MTTFPEGGTATAVEYGELEAATSALESLVAALDDNGDMNVLIQQMCQHAVRVVPGADMASVTLIQHDGTPHTAACTDDTVYHLDTDQYNQGEGPCIQAATTGAIVRVDTDEARYRWPRFANSASQAGVGSYLSVPLVVNDRHSGAINLFGRADHGYRDVDEALLELYVTAVAGALRAAERDQSAQRVAEQLRQRTGSRAIIEQAKGILIGTHHVTPERAAEMLSARSQRHNVQLEQLATDLVASSGDTSAS